MNTLSIYFSSQCRNLTASTIQCPLLWKFIRHTSKILRKKTRNPHEAYVPNSDTKSFVVLVHDINDGNTLPILSNRCVCENLAVIKPTNNSSSSNLRQDLPPHSFLIHIVLAYGNEINLIMASFYLPIYPYTPETISLFTDSVSLHIMTLDSNTTMLSYPMYNF